MSGKFDLEKIKQDKDKLKFYAVAAIAAVVVILFVVGLITGKNLLPGTGGGSSDTTTSASTLSQTAEASSSTEITTAEEIEKSTAEETSSAKVTSEKTTSSKKTTSVKKTTTTAKTTVPVTTSAAEKEYRFRSKSQLNQHFDKHGSEFAKDFGYKTAAEYEKGASAVINDPRALHKTEKEDGDLVYYIEETNEFVILSTDGYIRTYFRPSAGKAYYDRQ